MSLELLFRPRLREGQLARAALDLGAAAVGGPLSKLEREALDRAAADDRLDSYTITALRDQIEDGMDPLGGDYFVMTRQRARELGLEMWCRPAITEAREILDAGGVLRDSPERRLLLSLPRDIDRLAHPAVDAYLKAGECSGNGQPPVSAGYICCHRKPWWYMGRCETAPIVASYMARRAPAFALNPDALVLLNVGHGIYPRSKMGPQELARLVSALNSARESYRGKGRTYQGGLEKFEPGEMEALVLP